MELKIFGKSLFEFKKQNQPVFWAEQTIKTSEFLTDFYDLTGNRDITESVIIRDDTSGGLVAIPAKDKVVKSKELTPKKIYRLKLLNDEEFKIKTNTEYVDEQINDFKQKLELVKYSENDISRGIKEISSILIRMENRKKYGEFESFYQDYPYTSTIKIKNVMDKNNHLRLGRVEQFVADLPSEAVETMKQYTENTKKLCDKKPIYYIIANKKDFQKSEKRKDPILLAQSPFGHFWQILGAWDKEMLLLENL